MTSWCKFSRMGAGPTLALLLVLDVSAFGQENAKLVGAPSIADLRKVAENAEKTGDWETAFATYCRLYVADRGAREIQIRYLGRGHTAGDVVVFLPNEKVVITGDFLTSGLSNMSDSFPDEWVASLDALKKLDFDTVLPGHGDAFTDKAKIDYFQAYLRDVWSEVSRLKQKGVSAAEAAKQADLTKHKGRLPIQGPGVPALAATRIYELLDQRR